MKLYKLIYVYNYIMLQTSYEKVNAVSVSS